MISHDIHLPSPYIPLVDMDLVWVNLVGNVRIAQARANTSVGGRASNPQMDYCRNGEPIRQSRCRLVPLANRHHPNNIDEAI